MWITAQTVRHRRRYGEVAYRSRRAQFASAVSGYLRALAALPATIRAYPAPGQDTRAGHLVRWERTGWVIRPAIGWRSWRWPTRPLRINDQLGPDASEAASDWALEALAIDGSSAPPEVG